MRKKSFLLLLLPFWYLAALAQTDLVTLFEQCNYGGARHTLGPGTYGLHDMKVDNDKLSSMIIPAGLKVTIYENDKFEGRSKTYYTNSACLEPEWRNMASSLIVERDNRQPGYNQDQNNQNNQNQYNRNNNNNDQSDFVTFYNDCENKGYSQALRPGSYTGAQLGALKYNISSFTISGNLSVRAYLDNENLAGNAIVYETNVGCLPGYQNDHIGSLTIEKRSSSTDNRNNNGGTNNNDNDRRRNNNEGYSNNNGGGNNYATIYTECNYRGNSLRLAPGNYQGDKLGLLKYAISSIQIPSNLTARVYLNNEYLNGSYYILTSNTACLSGSMNDRIGSLVIEENNGYNQNDYENRRNQNQNHYPDNNRFNQRDRVIVLYADKDYKGESVSLAPGSYNTMAEAGFPDNALSSITIPAGYRVILYDKENFRGTSVTLNASRGGLSLMGFNDKTSSLVIYRDY